MSTNRSTYLKQLFLTSGVVFFLFTNLFGEILHDEIKKAD